MQRIAFLTILLVACVASAAPSSSSSSSQQQQQQQQQQDSQASPSNQPAGEYFFSAPPAHHSYQHPQSNQQQYLHHHQQQQQQHAAPVEGIDLLTPKFHELPVVSSIPSPVVSSQQQVAPVVVGNAPSSQVVPVSSAQVGEGVQVGVQQQQNGPVGVEHVHHQISHPMPGYYAPSGLITVVGEQAGQVNKQQQQVGSVRNFEQYGQPESASIPANYKPFGSWGLYIGGNPADGYYTNYYKALGDSVEKQKAGVESSPVKPATSGSQAFSPLLKQASSFGGDFYPFAYSPSELNSGHSVPVQHSAVPQVVSPVQAGAQVYGSPNSFEYNSYAASPYVDSYATKKMGAAYAQKEAQQKPLEPPKGYQSRVYVYPSASPVGPLSAPVSVSGQPVVHAGQSQVVAYPVPVGSQIVGSQQGVDGSFAPYGVHAFTRYAVKPTVVHQSDPSHYYGVYPAQSQSSSSSQSSYKQFGYPQGGASYYPLSYYGYPLSQLHYSSQGVGQVVPSIHGEQHHNVVGVQSSSPVDGGVEKIEKDEKPVSVNQQQKKA